jgi:hypothetical protein
MGKGDTLLNALIGAAVTVVLSFTGFSPLLGGGVAGYLQKGERMEGARVGAISGAIATVPFVLLVSVVLGFLGLFAVGGGRGGLAFGAIGFVVFFVILVIALLWNVALSAAGGYIGVYIHQEEGGGHAGGRAPQQGGAAQPHDDTAPGGQHGHGGQGAPDEQEWGTGHDEEGQQNSGNHENY